MLPRGLRAAAARPAGTRQRLGTIAPADEASAALFAAPRSPMQLAVLPGRGRGLLARRRISAGETILSEAPLASIGLVGSGSSGDTTDGDVGGPLGEQLDREWAAAGDGAARLSLRVLALLCKHPALWPDVQLLCSAPQEGNLRPSWAPASDDQSAQHVHAALGSCTALGGGDVPDLALVEAQWRHTMGAVQMNSFRLGHVLWPAGQDSLCLFLRASFFNHSCEPNIQPMSWLRERKGGGHQPPASTPVAQPEHVFAWTAMKPIQKGEELCVSYIGQVAHEADERADQLVYLEQHFGIKVA